jgi:phytoene desaturase (3,4-didehydrolycopene-forming)
LTLLSVLIPRLLQWTETCEGIWYPIGGFHRVVQSLIDIATSLPNPAKFHYNAEVERVLYDATGRASGIQLKNGEKKHADVVVVNADLVWAHNNLFKKDNEEPAEQGVLKEPRLAKKLTDKPHSYVLCV